MIVGVFKAGFASGWHTTETITNSYPPIVETALTIGRNSTAGDGGTVLKMALATDNRVAGYTTAAINGDVGFSAVYIALLNQQLPMWGFPLWHDKYYLRR